MPLTFKLFSVYQSTMQHSHTFTINWSISLFMHIFLDIFYAPVKCLKQFHLISCFKLLEILHHFFGILLFDDCICDIELWECLLEIFGHLFSFLVLPVFQFIKKQLFEYARQILKFLLIFFIPTVKFKRRESHSREVESTHTNIPELRSILLWKQLSHHSAFILYNK